MVHDDKEIVREHILDRDGFVKASFSGSRRGESLPWRRVQVRPVAVKGKRQLQFSYFDDRKDISKNFQGEKASEALDELLALDFKSIQVTTTQWTIQVQFTKKGKALVSRKRSSEEMPDLSHDRRKGFILPVDKPDPFLQTIGIMTSEGKVKANMRAKFRQINKFLELLQDTGELAKIESSPLHIIDMGCGNAHLTFAVYHFLNNILGRPAHLTGVDVQEDLIQKHSATCDALGWENVKFEATNIIGFEAASPPDIVLALHACDTATDEALAQGIRWGSRLILSAPCCHHHLQAQLDGKPTPPAFDPVYKHGILGERMGDILTDSLRALILRIMGYRTRVIEFISSEHTAKNLMIRAIKSAKLGEPNFMREYLALKAFWGVTPHLETLLGDDFSKIISVNQG